MKIKNETAGILILIIFVMTLPVKADVFMKQKTHTDGFQVMGQSQPAKETIQTIWIADKQIRSDDEQQSIIIRLDQNQMIMLDHAKKTYSVMPLDVGTMADQKMQEAMEQQNMSDEEKANAMSMMQGMSQIQVTVTPTNEQKKIGEWDCQKYLQEVETMMGPSTSEIWATQDLDIDEALYSKFMAAMSSQGGMLGNTMSQMMTELKKIKGIPVRVVSTTNMMGMSVKSSTELLEYKTGTAPSGHFDIPTGYKKTDNMSFEN